ncbi:survival protein sure-like phosphatase/nucleotidase [Mycena floridula]|nr:survival protein sure-like phosphatase/nucleotidase [Mycena floridula]
MRVLLTNDDGPPGPESPYILGFYQALKTLGWTVMVCLPSTQRSWIGTAYLPKCPVKGHYFYPREDGQGETSTSSRPLIPGELAEWILLDSTPAACSNIAIHNIYPGEIDLVISGPNLGRNSSAAFSLSSGTLGAALSASLSRVPSIAVSYGTVIHPTPPTLFNPAHVLALKIIQDLCNKFGDTADLFSINIPMIMELLSEEGLVVAWTTLWKNSYSQLFKKVPAPETDLTFKWAPDMTGLINPSPESLTELEGTDAWALAHKMVSVTPLRAVYEAALTPEMVAGTSWKMKL